MKVLLVIDSLGSGGAQKQICLLARGLHQRKHKVDFFTYYPAFDFFRPSLEALNISVISAEKKSRLDITPVLALRKVLHEGQYDVAVSFLTTPSLYLLAARGRAPLPVIVSHRQSYPSRGLPLSARLPISAYAAANLIVSNSYYGAEQIAYSLPFVARKLHVIPNGLELESYTGLAPDRAGDDLILLFVGRLSPEKNVHRLLEALSLIRQKGRKPTTTWWAGRRESGTVGEAYAAEIDRLVVEFGLSENWVPLGQRDDIPAVLSQCDGVILPSTFEGTPNAVCEGLAAARPVLASRIGDMDKLVRDGISGLLFDAFSPADMAEKILRFEEMSPAARTAMGKEGRAYAERELSASRYLDAWEACLRSVQTS